MFCHKCGTQLPDGSAFCQKCGAKLTSDIKAQPAPASSPNKGVPVQPYPQQQAGIPAAHAQVPPQQYASPTFPPKKKSKAPKIILGILGGIFGLFVLLIIIGIVTDFDDTGSSQSPSDATANRSSSDTTAVDLSQSFVSEEDGISFKYPSAWVLIKEENYDEYVEGNDFETLAVLVNETKDLPENTTSILLQKCPISSEEEAGLSISEKEYIEAVQSDSYTIKSAPVIQLDGVSCRKITAVDSDGDGYTVYTYVNGSFFYRIEINWVGETPGSNQKFFDAIMDSCKITPMDDPDTTTKSSGAENNAGGNSEANLKEGINQAGKKIIVEETKEYRNDIYNQNFEVTLDYVEFVDEIENDSLWGDIIYPEDNCVFLRASVTIENIGTTYASPPFGPIVYDGIYEYDYYATFGGINGIKPLVPAVNGALIFEVPMEMVDSNKSIELVIGYNDEDSLTYTIRN